METQSRQMEDKFVLRMEDGLRDRIKVKAAENRRSMTAEINLRLIHSLEAEASHAPQK